jgi:hypothetical protein
MFNFGGQIRILETGCGWRCVGHPREVNGKFKIHKRLCEICRESHTKELPKFSNEAANINGSWKGIKSRNNQPTKVVTSAMVDGEQYDILCDANNIDNAINEGKFTALNIVTGRVTQEPILTKSQKKRRNKKAKKSVANVDVDNIEELLVDLEEER